MTNIKKQGIVAKIMAILNLGEEGHIGSFFNSQKKTIKNRIKKLQANIANITLQHEQQVEEVEMEIEDATQAVEDAYYKIDPNKIKSNAEQKEYGEIYWNFIDKEEAILHSLNTSLKVIKEVFETAKKEIEDQIEAYQKRATKIV